MRRKYKIITVVLVTTMILVLGSLYFTRSFAASNTQTIPIKVKAIEKVKANPGVYWYQLDDGSFIAETHTGNKPAKNTNNNIPATTHTRELLYLDDYPLPPLFLEIGGTTKYQRAQLSKLYITNINDVEWETSENTYKGISKALINGTTIDIVTETGEGYTFNNKEKYGTQLGTNLPKYLVSYLTPLTIQWYGEVEETKEIRVVEDSILKKGTTKQYRAEVRTKLSGGSWSSWVDVSSRSETTWSSDKSSVASVSSSGLVSAKSNGQAKITATWKSGKYNIQASASAKVGDGDSIFISGSSSNVCLGDEIRLSAKLTKKDGSTYTLTAHPSLTWSSSKTSIATITSSGVVTPKAVGSTTITTKFVDSSQGINVSDSFELNVYDCSVTPPPGGGGETEEPNDPPEVTIIGPDVIKAGDEFCISASAFDRDGTVEEYYWSTPGMSNGPLTEVAGCGAYYMEEGTKTVTVTVFDDDGASAQDTHTILVVPPTPEAHISLGGTLKENRKVVINSSSSSPKHYPIQWEQSYFTVKPLEGQNLNVMKTKAAGAVIKDGKLFVANLKSLESLYKLKGNFEIEHYVINTAGLSDSVTQVMTIAEDLKPVAKFSAVSHLYRSDEFDNFARLYMTNQAESEDDLIDQVIYEVIYDSNSDRVFNDAAMTFSNKSLTVDSQTEFTHPNGMKVYATLNKNNDLELLVPRVGEYKVYQEVIEAFGQPTIDEFITEADYRRDKTK